MASNEERNDGGKPDMKALESVQKALENIEASLGEKTDIHALAASVSLSPFYFQRLFKDAVGYTVEEYIRLRRLARSTELLRGGSSVTEAAMECGFESASHFSRSFTETYGMTPSEFQNNQKPLFHVMKPDILLMNRNLGVGELYVSGGMVLRIDVRQQEETNLVGVDVFCPIGIGTPGVDNPGVAWERFHPVKQNIPNLRLPGTEFGVSYSTAENPQAGGFHYLAAAEVSAPGELPEGLTAYTLPAGLYARCVYQNPDFETAVSANLKSAIDYLCKWQAENGYEMDGWFEAECYGPAAHAEPFELEIWHRVKKV